MAKPKVAMVLANNFEDSEAIDPKNHLEALGAEVVTIGATKGTV
ncbi:MAG: protease, partial [Chloroflexia bacterium]|nr:protease [Chloroflexia bacterium]